MLRKEIFGVVVCDGEVSRREMLGKQVPRMEMLGKQVPRMEMLSQPTPVIDIFKTADTGIPALLPSSSLPAQL